MRDHVSGVECQRQEGAVDIDAPALLRWLQLNSDVSRTLGYLITRVYQERAQERRELRSHQRRGSCDAYQRSSHVRVEWFGVRRVNHAALATNYLGRINHRWPLPSAYPQWIRAAPPLRTPSAEVSHAMAHQRRQGGAL